MSPFPAFRQRLKTSAFLAAAFGGIVLLGRWLSGDVVFRIMLVLVGGVIFFEWTRMARRRLLLWGVGSLFLGSGVWAFYGLERKGGWSLALWVIGGAMVSDTAAYGFGSWLRGPKLCPSWSPQKTLSGALSSFLITTLIGGWIGTWIFYWSWSLSCLKAAVVAVSAQVGDLLESLAKRKCGVKDSGAWLAGHGGMLDRTDSWIGAALGFMVVDLLKVLFFK